MSFFFLFFFGLFFCTLEAALNFNNEAQEESRPKVLLHPWLGWFFLDLTKKEELEGNSHKKLKIHPSPQPTSYNLSLDLVVGSWAPNHFFFFKRKKKGNFLKASNNLSFVQVWPNPKIFSLVDWRQSEKLIVGQ